MQKIKVVFVQHSLPRAGGAEQVLYDLISRLDRDVFDPVLCCLYELGELGEQLKLAGCKTYENVAAGRCDPRNVSRLAKILRAERADLLYVTDAFHNTVAGRLAAWMARTPQAVLAFHSFDTVRRQAEGTSRLRRLVEDCFGKLLNSRFERIIALAESHKQYLVSTKGIPAEKIAVIYNGVDQHRFLDRTDRQEARRSLGLPLDKQLVGIVAGLRRYKAHDMFLKSAEKIYRGEPQTAFVIAGVGPERERLQALTHDLGLADHVHFLGQVKDIPRLLQALDVSVLSSFHEAFPLALLESMASARAVVSTDVGSVSEIIDDGINGFRVPFGAVDEFAERVLVLLRNPELARQFGEAGRRKVDELFTVERMVRQTELVLQDLARSGAQYSATNALVRDAV